ncbi:SARP family transcriptional regulator [Catellatospora sp. IY07-71]|uniref:AfsR/SARP family transcriptional regulator n=1 Tax=Catellatospora sp. IY07-71 TaxID=2728827 RepID=UPI001BB3E112|nr:BTAD domain-containing putative transcriptional regulator [Catellatospora sp. IY07-71]BCJ74970.1 SARP family transcriptional regulator [Catellatospora sp. IY07-71]
MRFDLLGPLRIEHDGQEIEIRRRQERCLLCVLLLEPGRLISTERLLDLLWAGDPPASGRATLHTYVARLRAVLAPHGVTLTGRGGGYRLDVAADAVDLHRFADGLDRAAHTTDPAERLRIVEEALALWRGPLLADVADEQLRERLGVGIDEQRLIALELRARAQLDCGMHRQAVEPLVALAAEHPYREGFTELLMLALYRCGRTADALQSYRGLHRRLVDQVGVEPGPALRRLQQQILNDDPALLPQTGAGRRFLPWDVPDFTGRADELRWLDDYSRQVTTSGAVLITAIGGTGGVGKTALAVRWARQAADRYPDGQLYLNLRGYDERQPMAPSDALAQLLRMLGVDPVPADVEEAAALYRDTLAPLRVVLLLDNAATVEQVRPLLPGGAGNFVMVTSRARLLGLVARDGAQRLNLAVLPEEEAVELIRRILGPARVDAEPDAAQALAAAAGRLPLALRIAAANLHERPRQTIAGYLAELHGGDRLGSLTVDDDPDTAVRTVFSHSYRHLNPVAQQTFRLLGAVPGPDLTASAAAALTGLSEPEAAAALSALCDAGLLTERHGRYQMHDLVKLYAAELGGAEAGAEAALERLTTWYVAACAAADRCLKADQILPFTPPEPPPVSFDDTLAALHWFDAEAEAIIAVVTVAEHRLPRLCWQLTMLLAGWLERRRTPAERLGLLTTGVRAAQAAGDTAAQASAESSVTGTLYYLDRFDDAMASAQRVVELRRGLDDPKALALSLSRLGISYGHAGRDAEAVAVYEESLALLRDLPDGRLLTGTVSNNLGWAHYLAGRHQDAIACYTAAADVARSLGDNRGASFAEGNLGLLHGELGDQERRLLHWRRSAEAGEKDGDRRLIANAYDHIGQALAELGDTAQARDHLERALGLYEETENAEDADAARAALAALDR